MKNLIKIIGLSIVLMAIGMTAHAQKCKYDYEKKDPMTGYTTKGIVTPLCGSLDFGLAKTKDSCFVVLSFEKIYSVGEVGQNQPNLEAGETLQLKLSNEDIISMIAQKRVIPSTKVKSYGIYNKLQATYKESIYKMSCHDMEKISQYLITLIRLEVSKQEFDFVPKEKESQKLQEAAKCMLQ